MESSTAASSLSGCIHIDQMRFHYHDIARFLWKRIFPVQFTLGVLGNSLNLWVLTSNDIPNNIANDLLAAVSLCDLSFLLAMSFHSLAAFDALGVDSPTFRLFYMQTRVHVTGFANWMSASAIWLILAVSIERFLVVRDPLRSKKYWGGGRRACVVGAIFIATGALTMYHHFEFDCEIVRFCNGTQMYPKHPIAYGSKQYLYPLPSTKYYIKGSTLFNAILVVFVPIIFVGLLNIMLLRTLHSKDDQLESGMEQLGVERRKRTANRVTATVVSIALCFSITQGPSAVTTLYELYTSPKSTTFYIIFSLSNSLVITGKTTNFILFCLSSAFFRSKCLGLIFRKFPKLQASCIGQRLSEYTTTNTRIGSIRTIRSNRRDSAPFIIRNEDRDRSTILEDAEGERREERALSLQAIREPARKCISAPTSPTEYEEAKSLMKSPA